MRLLTALALKPAPVVFVMVAFVKWESHVTALAHLHSKGFAHSHIIPSNIMAIGNQIKLASDMVLPLGEPRLAYRPLDAYDAPEVATALVKESSDVWSLGVTLVEALTQEGSRFIPGESGRLAGFIGT